ncbi:hypothetical protein ACU686_32535 [Yinghuangia aomiensis]
MPIGGRLSDRVGARPLVPVGATVVGLVMVVFATADADHPDVAAAPRRHWWSARGSASSGRPRCRRSTAPCRPRRCRARAAP